MKKTAISIFVLILCAACALFAMQAQDDGEVYSDYLRIHVRANSNSADDQQVKYEIKDEVVALIAPYVTECVTKEKALEVIGGILPQIERVCDRALAERGKTYRSNAEIRQEKFPTRVYGDLTLEEGIYDALIIELGSGEGDNWWCVIYPPLCFTSASASVEYRSLIADAIKKFFNK
ncbi:MAG: stage II sporulation protein R [Candidatus Coproplasma sp.]